MSGNIGPCLSDNVSVSISVISDLNPLAARFYPSPLITSRNIITRPTSNFINVISASWSHVQMKETAKKLNPLAPCFEKLLRTNDENSMFGYILNPSAPVFCITNSLESEGNDNSIMSTMDTTPLVLEIGTPDVSIETVLSDDDDLESLPTLSDNESVSELIEQVPNPADLSASQISNPATADDVIDLGMPQNIVKSLRQKNIDRIIIGHLNVNSIPNKIELLGDLIRGQIDIFLVSETKLNKSFPTAQFVLEGFADPPCRLDRNIHGGGLLLYTRDDITIKPLKLFSTGIECIVLEVSIAKK